MITHTFYAAEYEFTFSVPEDWFESGSDSVVLRPGDAIILESSEGPVFSPAITFHTAPICNPDDNIQKFLDEWFDGLDMEAIWQRFNLVSHTSCKVCDFPAARFEFEFDKYIQRWTAMALVISDGLYVHYVDGSFLSCDYSACHSVIRDILDSFRVSRPGAIRDLPTTLNAHKQI